MKRSVAELSIFKRNKKMVVLFGIITIVLVMGFVLMSGVESEKDIRKGQLDKMIITELPLKQSYDEVIGWLDAKQYSYKKDENNGEISGIKGDNGWKYHVSTSIPTMQGILIDATKSDKKYVDEIYQTCRMELELLFGPAIRTSETSYWYSDGDIVAGLMLLGDSVHIEVGLYMDMSKYLD